ncbi:hypothetical protein ACFRI7_07030 [Streptomyces sp. NPDC056716]|uniref:hypothetical protein n=1 Tax=unclassified Streptomyces TaxID=2593676 RepID=UPI0036906A22
MVSVGRTGCEEVGFEWQAGQPALLVQRGDRSDEQLADHEQRLGVLERSRWAGRPSPRSQPLARWA